ncbi:CocE/NonD family hydrolase [Streptomyces boncukensis]|uniref:CocE/NonD family hydrolase n=1 Tax=Streptomyces boncukensis TaxID=2711219 RepID=A0A6G4X829_9ACTN|nr:CocE/NonD family hydrolase [Streptomyces boncukensis]NGO72821.1 CocE/NonD family hydrolase [Streptomyces boncukensis]
MSPAHLSPAHPPYRPGRATDVRLPPHPGPHPAVVLRTPYDRRSHRAELSAWAARGFAAVAQDVRGRYAAGGAWHPYRDEESDGAATLAWIRAQEWSDGRVVAVGSSYAAYCALAVALGEDPAARPDAVIAAVPALGLAETARERTGPERLLSRAGWWAAHGDRPESGPAPLDPGRLEHLPVHTLLDLPSWPGVWEGCRRDVLLARAATAGLPLLAVGGTHDPFAEDTVRLWRRWGGPARLLLGPWGHGLTAEPAPGARRAHRVNLGELSVRWARAALSGAVSADRGGVVALGASDVWCDARLLVTSRGHGPVVGKVLGFGARDGLRVVSGREFTADPWRPVRSDTLDVPRHGVPDRCLLVTPPLPRPLDLLGAADVRLDAAADTPAADWAARLVALGPDGRAEPLAVGVVRRTGAAGEPRTFSVPLGTLARRLPAGTRLRLEIAGHHFPAHARNPHTGEDPVTATRLAASRRTVRPSGSALALAVAWRARAADPAQEIPS